MKEIKIKIYGWSDFKKWFWDCFCFPRRKLVAEWLGFYNNQMRMYTEEFLLKYNNKDFVKNNYANLNKALEDWDKEVKKIYDETMEMIMMK